MPDAPTTVRPDRRGRPRTVPLPDFGARALGDNPQRTMRILGLVRAGSSYRHICEIGAYQKTWTPQDVHDVLRSNGVQLDGMPVAPIGQQPTPVPLTARQMQISHRLCRAWTVSEIAAQLHLPESTVKTDVRNILIKSNSRDKLQYVVHVLTGVLLPCPQGEDHAS